MNIGMNELYLCCSSDTGKESMTRLEFKQRLSIAIGAAKGTNKTVKSCKYFSSFVSPAMYKLQRKGFKLCG